MSIEEVKEKKECLKIPKIIGEETITIEKSKFLLKLEIQAQSDIRIYFSENPFENNVLPQDTLYFFCFGGHKNTKSYFRKCYTIRNHHLESDFKITKEVTTLWFNMNCETGEIYCGYDDVSIENLLFFWFEGTKSFQISNVYFDQYLNSIKIQKHEILDYLPKFQKKTQDSKFYIPYYYENPKTIEFERVKSVEICQHTMGHSLIRYIEVKIPVDYIYKFVQTNNTQFHIVGMHFEHWDEYIFHRKNDFDKVSFKPVWEGACKSKTNNKVEKKFNCIRPRLYECSKDGNDIYIMVVTPGVDYLCHYAQMVIQFIDIIKRQNHALERYKNKELQIYHYFRLEQYMYQWTSFYQLNILQNDIVIMGHVEVMQNYFKKRKEFESIGEFKDYPIYSSCVCILNTKAGKKRVVLFGCKTSYWGELSGKIAKYIYSKGAELIIYVSKVATLEGEEHILSRAIIPTYYQIWKQSVLNFHSFFKIVNDKSNTEKFQLSGLHVSVPTVVGEDYTQRESFNPTPNTLDDEASYIADVALKYRKKYGSIHLVTDYIRKSKDKHIILQKDLSTEHLFLEKKKEMFEKFGDIIVSSLLDYFSLETCMFYQKGYCGKGSVCNFVHEK